MAVKLKLPQLGKKKRAVEPDSVGDSGTLKLVPRPGRGGEAVRAVGVLALLVLAGLGVRSAIAPPPASAQVQSGAQVSVEQVDTAGAAAVATRSATAWLTLDSPQSRDQRLGEAWAGSDDVWNGKGRLGIGQAYAVKTTVVSSTRVDVLVAVWADSEGEGLTDGWVGVLMPMDVSQDHPSVAATPTIVGLPEQSALPEAADIEEDPALAEQTRADIEAFFQAWSSGDVSALVAPGSTINPPRTGIGKAAVETWKVETGTGSTRSGQATVTWTIGEAQIRCRYTVKLTQVSSATGTRWQVLEIHN